jgi:hypothetical protein
VCSSGRGFIQPSLAGFFVQNSTAVRSVSERLLSFQCPFFDASSAQTRRAAISARDRRRGGLDQVFPVWVQTRRIATGILLTRHHFRGDYSRTAKHRALMILFIVFIVCDRVRMSHIL